MPSSKTSKQYGLWESLITPLSLAKGIKFSDAIWDERGRLFWLEKRANRGALVVQPAKGKEPSDIKCEISIAAKLGYGGGDFTVGNGHIYCVDSSSGRIYQQSYSSREAHPITPAFGRFASPVLSPDGKWLLFVHSFEGQDSLGIVDVKGIAWPHKLISEHDFYLQPTWHPNGNQIAWICWDHPNMPWDGTFLKLGDLRFEGNVFIEIENTTNISGDEKTSIIQPEFSPDGRSLAYISDKSGWWQLYLFDLESGDHHQLTKALAEHGEPAWIQGLRRYCFSPDGAFIYFLRNQDGSHTLWTYDLTNQEEHQLSLDPDYTFLDQIAVSQPDPSGNAQQISLIASGSRVPSRLIVYEFSGAHAQGTTRIVQRATAEEVPFYEYSSPLSFNWAGMDDEDVFGLYYPPNNFRFEGIEKPPLVVHVHSGPTRQKHDEFNKRAQFFANRGYAFLEVNYRGSTGYGRAYRNKLRGNWGIYDVQDAVSGARHLAEKDIIDKDRIVIMGSSAGGFTVLKALQDYPGFFKAGVCMYPVTNHVSQAKETHKFEAYYSQSLLGALPYAQEKYYKRSPLFHADAINDPVAIFQGGQDVVVSPKSSKEIADTLKRRGIPHLYHLYPEEGHGFRQPQTIAHFYTTIEQFLRNHVLHS